MSDTWEKAKKTVKKAYSSVTKPLKSVGKGLEKVAQGKIGEGLGDITETAAQAGLDIATGGNKDKVDALTGGALTSAQKAARGNSKDIIRTGATVGAMFGGPGTAMAVNSAFAKGGNVFDAGIAAAGGSGYEGIANVANSVLGNSLGDLADRFNPPQKDMPDPAQPIIVSTPSSPSSMNNNLPLILAGGGGLLLMMMMIMMNNKGK